MPELAASMNLVAIAVGAAVTMALGALWYSPLLFGNAWLEAIGKRPEDLGGAGPAMAGSMAAALVSAVAMEWLIAASGATTLVAGLEVGLVAALGLVATAMLSDSLFCGWGWRLYRIQAGYRVTYLVLLGALFGAWPR